ncbi:MAG: 5-dehydro-2-deoxygluconokinase [Chloroflexota bacterium]|nr:5-dehydro-2-deoxygluconokinase [Chloroflexota bacterium]
MTFDLLSVGRSCIDLYSNDVGAPFVDVTSFGAYVGGCPTNISVGARRLGLNTALLTAVGDDLVGDFVLHFLAKEGVETRFIPRKIGRRTSAVLLSMEPPDRFPLIFYRDNCADIVLSLDDVEAAPVRHCRALLISGTGLSAEPSRSSTIYAAQVAHAAGATVFLDLDFRPNLWADPRVFPIIVGRLAGVVDVLVGTENEVKAAAGFARYTVSHGQESHAEVEGDLDEAGQRLLAVAPVLVVKHGPLGASIHQGNGAPLQVAGFPVDVLNLLGAGDAFCSGLIYGRLMGWDWHRSTRMANAVGAIVVTRPACANSMPTVAEVEEFVSARGGL